MDFNWQLTILKERGLILENEEEALNFLHSSVQTNYIINYAVLHIWNALQQKMEISQIVCWLSWIIIMGYHHVQWDFHKNGKPNLYGVCNKTLRNYFFVGLRLLKLNIRLILKPLRIQAMSLSRFLSVIKTMRFKTFCRLAIVKVS